ncbi:MAG: polysaccharide deacetylase family protein, partial [Acidimicrobiales bacterium]
SLFLLHHRARAAIVTGVPPGWRRARCRVTPTLAGVGDAGHVALTFDDGPDGESTPAFLDALDELGWRATFFLLGSQVRRFPALAAEVAARGHEVGVHGDNHISHLRRPAWWAAADVERARVLIADTTGVAPRWFRPPYGALAASSLVAAWWAGLQPVLWTSWGRDWMPEATPASVATLLTSTYRPGATILLHDSDVTSAPSSWKAALGALPMLAETWKAAGLSVGPLSEHGLDRGRWASARIGPPSRTG